MLIWGGYKMAKDLLDDFNQVDGQMTIDDLFKPPENLFAVSRVFAKARKSMSLAEQKTFVYALSLLRFTEEPKNYFVMLDKKRLAEIIGIKSDSNHLSKDLYDEIKRITLNSYVEFSVEDKLYTNGCVIASITRIGHSLKLTFNPEYIGLFTNLSEDNNYITMWAEDIFGMTSSRSVQFYEYLRLHTNIKESVNSVALGVKALKEMFEIPIVGKGSYMRQKGGFDRSNFEKKVIQPLCNDLSKSKMITIIQTGNGMHYEKVKSGNRIVGYRFFWSYCQYPKVASATEVKEMQERVDKNPKVLKVAKDILKGDAKNKTSQKPQVINENRGFSLDDIERFNAR